MTKYHDKQTEQALSRDITSPKWLERQAKNPSRKRVTVNLDEEDLIALSVLAHKNRVTPAAFVRGLILKKIKRLVTALNKKQGIAA
jgi:hypothetical protein